MSPILNSIRRGTTNALMRVQNAGLNPGKTNGENMTTLLFIVLLLTPVTSTVLVMSKWDVSTEPAITDQEFQDEMGVYNEFGQ